MGPVSLRGGHDWVLTWGQEDSGRSRIVPLWPTTSFPLSNHEIEGNEILPFLVTEVTDGRLNDSRRSVSSTSVLGPTLPHFVEVSDSGGVVVGVQFLLFRLHHLVSRFGLWLLDGLLNVKVHGDFPRVPKDPDISSFRGPLRTESGGRGVRRGSCLHRRPGNEQTGRPPRSLFDPPGHPSGRRGQVVTEGQICFGVGSSGVGEINLRVTRRVLLESELTCYTIGGTDKNSVVKPL